MVLKLSDLLPKPIELKISSGEVYLFPITLENITSYCANPNEPIGNRLRNFLPIFVSFSSTRNESNNIVGLSLDQAKLISEDELNYLSQSYLESNFLNFHFKNTLANLEIKNSTQSFSVYLDFVLNEISKQHEDIVKQRNQEFFNAVKKTYFDSTHDASRMVSESMKNIQILQQRERKQSDERAEELEIARITRDMSMQTSLMLQELTKAAEKMLLDLEKRSEKADESTRKSLRIGLNSLYTAIFFSGLALFVSLISYTQDESNNKSGDSWQVNVLKALSESNEEQKATNKELHNLRNDLKKNQATKEPDGKTPLCQTSCRL
jgi:hypothetical protein